MISQQKTESSRCSERGFWALMATQFQGAFNDNAFKVLVVFLLPLLSKNADYPTTAIAFLIFNIPFLLFPSYAGFLADRFSKQQVTVFTKYWEVGVMLLGLAALVLQSIPMLWGTLFLMAMQSAFFSPAKYGILPEILKEERLSWGNGMLQLGTMVAIIVGTAVGAPLVEVFQDRAYLASGVLVVLSVLGLVASHFITRPQPAAPEKPMPWNPWAGLGQCAQYFRKDRMLLVTVLGIAYFWFAGTLAMQNIIELAKETVDSTALQGQLLTALSLGIGIGSVVAGFVSHGKIRMGLVPVGGFGIAVFSAVLSVGPWGFWGSVVLLFGLGFFGGFFVIPLDAMLQKRSPEDMRGDMIATCNFVTFSGMTVSAVLFYLLFNRLGFSTSTIFMLSAAMSLVVSIGACFLLPICVSHVIAWCLVHLVYRYKVVDGDNLPREGGALIVANHVSFVDTVILSASTRRKIRYLGDKSYCEAFLLRLMARLMGVLPVSTGGNPEANAKSLRKATAALESGEVVCIFAEGQLTRTGQLMPFRRGLERIMEGSNAPIIPVYMDNLWGSIFSHFGGRFFWKMPELLPRPVTVRYGKALPSDGTAVQVRQAVADLGAASFADRQFPLLHRTFVAQARRHPFRHLISDEQGKGVSAFKTLVTSIAVAIKLNGLLGQEKRVGVQLAPSADAAMVHIALQWLGKVPVQLAGDAGEDTVEDLCGHHEIQHILSDASTTGSKRFCVKEIIERISLWDRCVSFCWSVCLSSSRIEKLLGVKQNRCESGVAVVVAGNGISENGVALSHRNVCSSVMALQQLFTNLPEESIVGALPFNEPMGFVGTLWLPLLSGSRVEFIKAFREARAVGRGIQKMKATFLITTPDLLEDYVLHGRPEHFGSLKHLLVCGAEQLSPTIHIACQERLGIEPLEGYGLPACTGLLTLNVPNYRASGFLQHGTKHGSVGGAVPGVAVRIVDPDTFTPLETNQPGILLVKGPGVPDTGNASRNGWYNTGKLAAIDEDGFITFVDQDAWRSEITDALERYMKTETCHYGKIALMTV